MKGFLLIAICFFCCSSLAWGQAETTDTKDNQVARKSIKLRNRVIRDLPNVYSQSGTPTSAIGIHELDIWIKTGSDSVFVFNGSTWIFLAVQTGGGGGGSTNLTATASPTNVTINSDTGTDAAIPLATGTNAGLESPANKTKLDNVSVTQAVDLDAMEAITNLAWTSANDGAGSGLDADLLDGQNSTHYTNASNLGSGTLPIARLPIGSANQLLRTNAGATAAEWFTPSYLTSEVDGSTSNELQNVSYTASTRAVAISSGTGFTFPLFNSTNAGLVPLSGGGTTNFLRADGTWAAPSGGGSSGRDSMWIAAPDTIVHRNVFGVTTKFKLVFNLPADSIAASGSILSFFRRGSPTPLNVTLPNPTPAIVSVTGATNTTVTLTSGEVYEVNLSGVSTCNVAWASLTSGKQHKIYFQNGSATTLNLPVNTVILRDDGGTCLANPIVNKANTLIEGYTTSNTFYVTNSTVPLQCVEYDPAYQAVLDYATTQGWARPSLANQLYQSRLVDSLQANGIWDSLDVFYSFYTGSIADSNFTRINWKDPGGDDNLTAHGGRTYAALTGWNSNGTTGYLNTNWNPSTEGLRFDLNTASFGTWVVAPGGTGSRYNMGVQVSGGTTRMEENSGGRRFIINASGETTTTGGATSGLWHINRSGSGTTGGYLNGSLQTSDTDLSTSVSNGNLWLMGLNLSNAIFGPTVSTVKYRFAFAGGNLASRASQFYNILNAHVTNINTF
jgi:hypothetical protein